MEIIKKFFKSLAKWLENRVPEAFVEFVESHPMVIAGMFVVCLPFTGTGFIFATIYTADKANESLNRIEVIPPQPAAPVIAAQKDLEVDVVEDVQIQHFQMNSWWSPIEDTQDAYWFRGKTLTLADGYERVVFGYSEPVPVEQSFLLEISLGGLNGGNFQFGRLSGWELTIGDGDYQTITLKDGKGNPVPEISSGSKRPMLSEKIARDIAFVAEISEERLSTDVLRITIRIKEEEFLFNIPIPEKWNERDDMYFGLIDYSMGENKTSVLCSDLTEKINHR